MNKEEFISLVHDQSSVPGQFGALENLSNDYPYCESIRVLLALASKTDRPKSYKENMTLAAFYITDRNVLRSLLETGKAPSESHATKQQTEAKKVVLEAPITKTDTKKIKSVVIKQNVDADKLRTEVLFNLDQLIKNKNAFNKWIESTVPIEQSLPVKSPKKPTSVKPKPNKKTSTPKASSSKKKKNSPDTATSGKKKRSTQTQLIDQFIEDAPKIVLKKDEDNDPSDLSKRSVEFKEDLISEYLAEILAQQGKTNKAIDIYKKLIWKFPQKKASFAARIESLKK